MAIAQGDIGDQDGLARRRLDRQILSPAGACL